MNTKPRTVTLTTIFNLFKRKPIPMFIGFLFTILPVFLVTVLVIVFSIIGNDTPSVNIDLIKEKGTEKTAEITGLDTQYNITINNVNPTIIHYTYENNGKTIQSKYRVLEKRKIEDLEIGSAITIKEYEGDSIIMGLKPYDFGIWWILLLPIPFLFIGIPLLIYSILQVRKEVNLYKYGTLSNGKIISMMPKSGLPITNIGQGVIVHYEYEVNGTKMIGESITTDFSIMSNKKKDDMIPIFVATKQPNKTCVVPKIEALKNNWNVQF